MDRTCLILLWLSSSFIVSAYENPSVSEATNSIVNNTETLKGHFSKSVTETILKFSGFFQKFDVPYLGVQSAISYAKEIAKAIAFAPLFKREDWIQDYAMEHLMLFTLPSSPNYCNDVWCAISNIVNIMTDVSVDGGFISTSETEQVVEMKANNLAGNVLWRLSRLKNPNADILTTVKNYSRQITDKYSKFVNMLAGDIYKSDYVSSFCLDSNLNSNSSRVLTTFICGSRFLDFKLSLIPDMADTISHIYHAAKKKYHLSLNSTMYSLVSSSAIAETIALNMMKQGYFENNDDLKEVAGDVLKLLMVGITNNRMHIQQ